MTSTSAAVAAILALVAPCAAQSNEELRQQVRQREESFARTMADRDHVAFVTFIADEAIFVGRTVLRGKTAVSEGWKRYFEGTEAPFSWAPERVEVLDSGTLAMTSGPVLNRAGARVGTFNSVWRRDADGRWRIILDSGCPPCDCPPAAAPTAPPA